MGAYTITAYVLLTLAHVGFLMGQLYFIVSATDLESDFVNPVEFCSNMEWAFPVEAAAQGLVPVTLVFLGDFVSIFIVMPVTLWNAYRFSQGRYKLDATKAFKEVSRVKIEGFLKLTYYFFLFCWMLYCMIDSLVE